MSSAQINYLRPVRIIFASVVLFPFIFLATVIYMQSGSQKQPSDYSDPLLYACIIFATSAVIGSTLNYRFRMAGIKQLPTLITKLNAWRSVFIVSIAMIEAPTIFSAVCLLIKGYDIFLYIAAALLATQFMNWPAREKIKKDLDLSDEDAAGL